MATPVIMPRQGQSVESCIISKWNKKKGDKVEVGEILFSYETDKSSFDEESKVAGVMLDVFFEEGDDVPCLTNVCVIGEPGESTAEFAPAVEGAAVVETVIEETPKEQEKETPVQVASAVAGQPGGAFISPRARNLAQRQGIDYTQAQATGPNGRIIERDIEALAASGAATFAAREGFIGSGASVAGTGIGGRVTTADLAAGTQVAAAEAQPVEAEYVDVPMTNIRKVISKSMVASLNNIAQLTYNMAFDMTNINAFRAMMKANGEKLGIKGITINDIIVYTAARILKNHPDCNAHCLDNTVRRFSSVHMGIAVDTERGLMVPTLRNADTKSLAQISKESKELSAACQKGDISPDKLGGATFTISNLGSLGMESFTPVINPPQTAILGVNTIETRFRVVDGAPAAYQAMNLSLTTDHRVLDGAPSARFLKELVTALENFSILLAK